MEKAGLKVLLTHELFAPDFAGGGERMILEVARELHRRNVLTGVLTTGDPRIAQYEDIPTIRLPISRHAFNFAVPQIVENGRNVDVIQTFNYHACLPSLIAGRLLRKPVVCVFLGIIQGTWTETHGPIAGRARILWERFLLSRRFSRVLFLSEENRDTAVRLGVRHKGMLVNPPGVPSDLRGPGEKNNGVLFVGKFDTRKGVYDVLEVARALPQIHFRMIGYGDKEEELRGAAPPNVELSFIQERAAVREAYARASIFFLPSKAEGLPLALVEAMASGCAIVSSVPMTFEGISVVPGDRKQMEEAISRLWSDPAETARMGKENVELAKAYTWERHVDMLLRTYWEALEDQAG